MSRTLGRVGRLQRTSLHETAYLVASCRCEGACAQSRQSIPHGREESENDAQSECDNFSSARKVKDDAYFS